MIKIHSVTKIFFGLVVFTAVPFALSILPVLRPERAFSNQAQARRKFIQGVSFSVLAMNAFTPPALANKEWEGTCLKILSLNDAYIYPGDTWEMGRWPDASLRKVASVVPKNYFNTEILKRVCQKLKATCKKNNAVGLAAQQCGVNAAIVYLEKNIILINPRIVARSPEIDMKVWEEKCLVLPPEFTAVVLRDNWIVVEAEDAYGKTLTIRLDGELARACQHEMDHSNGILIVDHVDLEDMPSYMSVIEMKDHLYRQNEAFSRITISPSVTSHPLFISVANAEEFDSSKCNMECQERIRERRALFKQSRTTRSRQEIFDLSRQRAMIYNTTSNAASCIAGFPCY